MIPLRRKSINEVKAMERQLKTLRPAYSAGVATSHTTRGVTRVAVGRSARASNTTTTNLPKWG